MTTLPPPPLPPPPHHHTPMLLRCRHDRFRRAPTTENTTRMDVRKGAVERDVEEFGLYWAAAENLQQPRPPPSHRTALAYGCGLEIDLRACAHSSTIPNTVRGRVACLIRARAPTRPLASNAPG
eukprot:CAMPEP_0119510338 /NCGR_PEP_ID=MMETSP1344-20130328/29355_1 /TAXON_ID=236787 /ORGANISM="Florenciella parvula, Strain CCMP2471" /LENGTH=123 /DNA_ID=CAMNT_0007547265 /DNA_START=147 /DNA_END=516 /DNA_ORIENTATION=+